MTERDVGFSPPYTTTHNQPTDTRLALLEDRLKRVEDRLNTVSDRTHTLINSVNHNNLLADEARDQRSHMLTQVNRIEHNMDTLDKSLLTTTLKMGAHVESCDKRGGRLQAIGLVCLAALLSLLGLVIMQVVKGIP